jgi:hypothetical protein
LGKGVLVDRRHITELRYNLSLFVEGKHYFQDSVRFSESRWLLTVRTMVNTFRAVKPYVYSKYSFQNL